MKKESYQKKNRQTRNGGTAMSSRILSETIPVAPLKILIMPHLMELGKKVNQHLVHYRGDSLSRYMENAFDVYGYRENTYLMDANIIRFGSGEAKAQINESIRGKDLFILGDILDTRESYQMYGKDSYSSPDDNFQNLKRLIAAASISHPYRINLIMPFLYEGRRVMREKLESLDCAAMLQELSNMGVENFITFEAHDVRVQNAIPIRGFDNFMTSLQMIRELLKTEIHLRPDKEHLMVISPDEGGMNRAMYYSTVLGVEMGTFYKRRNYFAEPDEDEEYPVESLAFLGSPANGRAALVVDDLIASGNSLLHTARELKQRGFTNIYLSATFGIFNHGLQPFDEAFEQGLFDRLYTTNLTRLPEELKSRPYYSDVDVSKYVALIIDTLNHDTSINDILNPSLEIQALLKECQNSFI